MGQTKSSSKAPMKNQEQRTVTSPGMAVTEQTSSEEDEEQEPWPGSSRHAAASKAPAAKGESGGELTGQLLPPVPSPRHTPATPITITASSLRCDLPTPAPWRGHQECTPEVPSFQHHGGNSRPDQLGSEWRPYQDPKILHYQMGLHRHWIRPKQHTKEEIGEAIILEQLLRVLPADVRTWVKEHEPEEDHAAAKLALQYLNARREGPAPRSINTSH
ncbi:SCAN domain-containing protein 1-like [Sphaeramia orbicularis]|uniref:SCAN domain-containing protein 1-like n=1 Tax=Sphaeramia orbicularis TaxID=375764 RepID=UPI00117E01A9|nr:SCAN domain-containing protein 1-like [Sphaeramia orbicularis]